MKANERVILIKGDASKWYEQAIFIVNRELPPERIPVDFVAEAEKIINNYVMKKSRPTVSNTQTAVTCRPAIKKTAVKNKRFDFILNMVMLVGCLAIAGLFLYGIWGA